MYSILFLQQTAGYSPASAGLAAAVPVIVLFFFSQRLGAFADRFSPRWFVAGGALLAGVGILLLLRADAQADFLTVVLPSVLVHGIGLTLVVAPLTSGVLNAVGEEYAGIASGVNNAVARIGSMLAIAVIGILISMQFSSAIDTRLTGRQSPAVREAVGAAQQRPLSSTPAGDLDAGERREVTEALTEASIASFRLGVSVMGGLAISAALIATAMGRWHVLSTAGRIRRRILQGFS